MPAELIRPLTKNPGATAMPLARRKVRDFLSRYLCLLLAITALLCAKPTAAQNASSIGSGTISTFAGGGGSGTDNVAATAYSFSTVAAVITDAHGNVYILDQSTGQVLMVYVGGTVPPLLGFRLNHPPTPYPAATATVGNIYVIAGISGNYASQIGVNNVCDPDSDTASTCGDDGSALIASMDLPAGIALDSTGNLYIADEVSFAIRKVSATDGTMSTIVGDPMHVATGYSGENVTAQGSLLSYPSAVALDSFGNIFISDSNNFIIREVTASTGKINTVAGKPPSGSHTYECSQAPCGDGGLATAAKIDYASGVYVASNGDIYITDQSAATIRKVTAATGIIATVAGTMPAAGSGEPFPASCVTIPCGDGGAATSAKLNVPFYAALDSVGNLLIADYSDDALRYVSSSTSDIQDAVGTTSFDGNYTGDTGPAIDATLNTPQGFAFDGSGNLYVADSGNLVVRKVSVPASLESQTITFGALPDVTYGVSPITLDATASSGLAVSYTVTGPATLSGSSLHITGSGSVTVTANQAGNTTYAAATPVSQTFSADKAQLTVTANNLSREVGVANPTLTYTITGLVNGDSNSVVTGTPVLSTTATTNSPIGEYPITVADGTLAAANYTFHLVNGTLTISGTTAQTITFAALPNITYGSANSTFTLTATASSGLPVTFTVTGPAVLQGAKLTASGAGLVTVTAEQPGNGTYEAAPNVARSFTVNPAALTITAANATRQYGQPNPTFTFNATGFVGGDTVAVLSGGPVFSTAATMTSDPGQFPITVVQGTLFAQNYTFTFLPGVLTVTQAPQVITFPPIPALIGNLGTTFTLQATSSSGLPVQYTATGVVSILSGGTLYVNGPGAATVTATQPGNADYAAAPAITQSFNVGMVPLIVQATSVSRPFGGVNPVFTYSYLYQGAAATLVPGSITGIPFLSTPANAQSPTGAYPIVIKRGTLRSSQYTLTFENGTLTVTPPASYTLTVDPGSVTVPIGQSRQVTVTLTPLNLYVGSVTLDCAGLPAGVTCTSSPATLTTALDSNGGDNIVQSTLTISAGQVVASTQKESARTLLAGLLWLPATLGGLVLLLRRRSLRRRSPSFFLGTFILLIASVAGISACGGGSHGGSSIQPGTTQVMVTGSGTVSPGTANTTQSVALTVVIQ